MNTDFIYGLNDKDLKHLQSLIDAEWDKREKNKKEEAKCKIMQLASEIDTLCSDYNIELFYNGKEFDSDDLYFGRYFD